MWWRGVGVEVGRWMSSTKGNPFVNSQRVSDQADWLRSGRPPFFCCFSFLYAGSTRTPRRLNKNGSSSMNSSSFHALVHLNPENKKHSHWLPHPRRQEESPGILAFLFQIGRFFIKFNWLKKVWYWKLTDVSKTSSRITIAKNNNNRKRWKLYSREQIQ